jgi:hypothetical protein
METKDEAEDKKDATVTFNLSKTRDTYFSQRNNVIRPTIRCKPTGTTEGLAIAGWPLPTGDYKQPEDNLTSYCEKTWGIDAPEDWGKIAEAINEHFLLKDKPVIGPRWDWDLREALFGITQGIPFVASTWLTKVGHIVTLVGFEIEQAEAKVWKDIDLAKVKNIIIDDPYGNRTSGHYGADLDGWNNKYDMNTWLTLWRSTGVQIKKRS